MKKTLLATLVLAAVSVPALAQDAQWYATLQGGKSKYDLDGLPGDNKDRAALIGLGYKFSPQLAVEGGFADFGKINFSGVTGEARSVYVAAMLSAPVSDAFSVYGRLGVASTDRRVGVSYYSVKDRKTEGLYGAGLSYAFTKNVAGTLEYMKLSDSDVDAVTLGVKFSF